MDLERGTDLMEEMRLPFIMNYILARAEVNHTSTPKELVAEANQTFDEIKLTAYTNEANEDGEVH